MIAALAAAWRHRNLIAAGIGILALLAGLWRIRYLSREIDAAHAATAIARETAEANAAAAARLTSNYQQALAAVTADRDAALARARRTAAIKEEIADAPASDDGPVAPVLRRALDRLHVAAPDPH